MRSGGANAVGWALACEKLGVVREIQGEK